MSKIGYENVGASICTCVVKGNGGGIIFFNQLTRFLMPNNVTFDYLELGLVALLKGHTGI